MSESRIKEKRLSLEIIKYCKQLMVLLKNSYDPTTSELQIIKRIIELLYSFKSVGLLKTELNKVLKEIIRKRLKTCLYKEERTVIYSEFLNLIVREQELWATLVESNGLTIISKLLSEATRSSNTDLPTDNARNILVHLTGLFKNCNSKDDILTDIEEHGDVINSLVVLLNTKDHEILDNSLAVLLMLSKKSNLCKIISHLNSVEILITIIGSYDLSYKSLASELLSELLNEDEPKQMVKICEGVQIFLRQIGECDVKTTRCIVQCLCKLSCDQELANEIKVNKGLEILLSTMHDTKFHPTNQMSHFSCLAEKPSNDELWIQFLDLKSIACDCISELVCYDNISFEVVQINAIFIISLLILPRSCHQHKSQGKGPLESSQSEASYHDVVQSWLSRSSECDPMNNVDLDNLGLNDVPLDNGTIIAAYQKMQTSALKALRFIFSVERNRSKFKKLFTPNLFEKFIDVGHYNRCGSQYDEIVNDINSLDEESLQQLKSRVENTNNNKLPMKIISDYAVIDVLGSGAFGTVYKVHKLSQPQTYFAMKEVYDSSSSMATADGPHGIKELHTELNILQENLCHQNIVQYYKSFIFDKRLYIVMEFIDGATLDEHISSTKEKGDRLTEERIWNIFVQLVLGLHYLHKEKRIVHRDLKPNNVMFDANDNRVILTDFGLAKQKNPENSKMISVVGSIQYSSPELVQNEEYGEKVDIWSLGCLLYHMCQLTPPFVGSNMLALVAKIVESRYEPIDKDQYSKLISSTIDLCLTSDQKIRPDINGVASFIGTILLSHLNEAKKEEVNLKKKLDNEKIKNSYNQFYDDDVFMASQSHDSGYLSNKLSPKLITWNANQSKETSKQTNQRKAWGSPGLRARSSDNKTRKHLSANQMPKLLPLKPTSLPPFHPKTGSKRSESHSIFSPQGVYRLTPSYEENENLVVTPTHYSPALLNRRLSRSSILTNSNQVNNYSILPDLNLRQGSKVILPKMHSAPNIHSRERNMIREVRKPVRASSSRSLLSSGTRVDPPIQFFNQLHKIIYITQLPPSLQYCPKRKIIEDFKRQLFQSSQTVNMSLIHIQKLMEGSHEIVDMKISSSVVKDFKDFQKQQASGDWLGDELTYFQLNNIVEQLLEENNY